MSFHTDPIRSLQQRIIATGLVGLGATAACAVWAFRPLPESVVEHPALQHRSADDRSKPAQPLDIASFAAKLWNPPPQQVNPEAMVAEQSQPAKPLNLQLIGIIEERPSLDGSDEVVRRAAVYDADRDVLLIISSGDRIREQTVKSITDQGIELTDGRSTRRLALVPST